MGGPRYDWCDARRDDPLNELRIPVVSTAHPSWAYLVAFCQDAIDGDGNRPTEQEARMLASFLAEYKEHWYGYSGFARKMAERPFDIDGGANGLVFRKWGDDDWGYRRRSWTMGPTFVPTHPRVRNADGRALTLEQVMDRIHTFVEDDGPSRRWVEWKAKHPDVFGGGGR